MSKYRYPYIKNNNEWKQLVNSEFYHEARNKGRRLTDSEKKAVVRSIKRDLEVNEDKIGLGRRSCRVTRLSSSIGESYGVNSRQKSLGSVSDFDSLYVDFLDYVHRSFEDLNIMIPLHHRKNLKNLLLRITSDQLRTLITSLFNHCLEVSNHKTTGDRPLWDEYKLLCSMSQYLFFYMISLGYMRIIMSVDPMKYVVYDYRFEITSYDLYYFNEHYGSIFSSFIRTFDHVPRDSRDPPMDILVILKVTEQPVAKKIIEDERKKEIINAARMCYDNLKLRLVEYGIPEKTIIEAVGFTNYVDSVNSSELKDIVYFSDFLKKRRFEESINIFCNNRRISKQCRGLGFREHASTLINYFSVEWDNLSIYNGSLDVISHSLVKFNVPKLDELDEWHESSANSSVSFGYPILKSPEGVSFVVSQDSPIVSSPGLRPPVSDFSIVNSDIRLVDSKVLNFGFGRRSR